ncbi:zinc finger protein 233-like [Wyeomyia smithii]|uniref:zinc finger protein 233-like n=1 Tax=Wyeomyia smithii TaxID=174621 RepID=UPI002467B4FB|nr:zinc finger protein 233-like [Wyeomyia smithii]
MEEVTQIKVEEPVKLETLPVEKKTSLASRNRCTGETRKTLTNTQRGGSVDVIHKHVTDITDEVEGTAACEDIPAFRPSNSDGSRIHKAGVGEHPQKKYICEFCNKEFSAKGFASHLKSHSGKTSGNLLLLKFKCDICKQRFSRKLHLSSHMKTHRSDCPYKCSICDERFSYSDYLTAHMVSHSDERPFKCDICDKSYKRSKALLRHFRDSHNSTQR